MGQSVEFVQMTQTEYCLTEHHIHLRTFKGLGASLHHQEHSGRKVRDMSFITGKEGLRSSGNGVPHVGK